MSEFELKDKPTFGIPNEFEDQTLQKLLEENLESVNWKKYKNCVFKLSKNNEKSYCFNEKICSLNGRFYPFPPTHRVQLQQIMTFSFFSSTHINGQIFQETRRSRKCIKDFIDSKDEEFFSNEIRSFFTVFIFLRVFMFFYFNIFLNICIQKRIKMLYLVIF